MVLRRGVFLGRSLALLSGVLLGHVEERRWRAGPSHLGSIAKSRLCVRVVGDVNGRSAGQGARPRSLLLRSRRRSPSSKLGFKAAEKVMWLGGRARNRSVTERTDLGGCCGGDDGVGRGASGERDHAGRRDGCEVARNRGKGLLGSENRTGRLRRSGLSARHA